MGGGNQDETDDSVEHGTGAPDGRSSVCSKQTRGQPNDSPTVHALLQGLQEGLSLRQLMHLLQQDLSPTARMRLQELTCPQATLTLAAGSIARVATPGQGARGISQKRLARAPSNVSVPTSNTDALHGSRRGLRGTAGKRREKRLKQATATAKLISHSQCCGKP